MSPSALAAPEITSSSSKPRKLREWAPTTNTFGLILFYVVHIQLGFMFRVSSFLSLSHAVLTLGAGIAVAVFGRRSISVIYVTAYMVGAEVLWRMTGASFLWELGKYELFVLFTYTFFRLREHKLPWATLFYFVLQLPAVLITYHHLGLSTIFRKEVLFSLSGPLALMASGYFFYNVRITREQLWRICLLLSGPALSMVSVGVATVQATADFEYGGGSNKIASGGFGPNQVAAVLGLSAALLLLYMAMEKMSVLRRSVVLIVFLVLTGQSALTFSRGGVYAASGAVIPAAIYMLRDKRTRKRVTSMLIIIAVIATTVMIPYLMERTEGKIGDRFANRGLTGRDKLMSEDAQAFIDHPVFGGGVAMGKFLFHDKNLASHNEVTRLASEHGMLGLIALGCLMYFMAIRFASRRGLLARALVSAMFTWSFLFLITNGFRIAAPAFGFGLGCVAFFEEDQEAGSNALAK